MLGRADTFSLPFKGHHWTGFLLHGEVSAAPFPILFTLLHSRNLRVFLVGPSYLEAVVCEYKR